ncbi:MAG: PEP-CTERM sorting domain-containing protein [Kiritimatiellae bacterium]|nr:PEP-CTERM sorting domain-containing protein [Kiritimatiellia bacterium]
MMKKFLSMLCAASLAAAGLAESTADVLMWYLDTDEDTLASGTSFDTIKFWAVDSGNNPVDLIAKTYADTGHVIAGTPSAGSGGTISLPADTMAGAYYTNLSGFETGYSFFMELYLNGSKIDWTPRGLSLSDFQAHMIASTALEHDMNLAASMQPYNFATTMVPEPSGGMLLVLGGALLALRRRKTV